MAIDKDEVEMSRVTRRLPHTWRRIVMVLTMVASMSLNLGLTNSSAHANTVCTYPNFDGCTLANMTFENKDLSGASFLGANLIGAKFKKSNLDGAKFGSSTSPRTKLNSATFESVSLQGAVFENVALNDVRSSGVVGEVVLPENWVVAKGYLVGPAANLKAANLSDANLSGLDLRGIFAPEANFTGADLSGVNFLSASLNEANLSKTNLFQTYFLASNLFFTVFDGANLTSTIFNGSQIGNAKFGTAVFDGVISQGGNLGNPLSTPPGWLHKNGCFIGPNARLESCDFSQENLSGLRAGIVEMYQGWAERLPVNWILANYSKTASGYTGFIMGPGADLQESDLSSFDLTRVSSGPYQGSPILPESWLIKHGYLVGPGTNLDGVNLSYLDMRGSNLNRASLDKADLSYGDFRGSSAVGATFSDANLSYARFDDVHLGGAWLVRAQLEEANLSTARIEGVKACNVRGAPILPTGYSIVSGNLVGPKVDLSYCDLRNANLAGVDLSGADLNGAKLRGADFTQTILTGAKFGGSGQSGEDSPRLPPGWAISNGLLIGPGTDLTDKVLWGDLALLDVSKEKLSRTRIYDTSGKIKLPSSWRLVGFFGVGPGADLTDANLNGVDLSQMDLTGVTGKLSSSTKNLALPEGWILAGRHLVGPGADLTGAKLSNTDLSKANLSGIRGQLSESANIKLPSGWAARGGYILGKYADISDQDLSGLNLEGVDLSLANLSGTRFTRVTGNPLLPKSFARIEDVILGPGVDASNITWLSTSLGSQSLEGANLTGFRIKLEFGRNAKVFDAYTADIDISSSFGEGWVVGPSGRILGKLSKTHVPAVLGIPKVGQTVTASSAAWDSGVTLTYQWLRDGAAISGANNSSYMLSTDDNNKQISVELTGTKTRYATVTKISAAVKIEDGTLTITPTPTVSGTFKVGQLLTANPGTWDSGVSLTYQWLRDGVAMSGETGTSLRLSASDFGKNISFTVNGTKTGYVTVSKESSKAAVSAGSLTSTTPKITGTAKTGSVLKATTSAWTKGAKITYQWLANGVAIKGATSSSLKLASSHKGKKISVKVTQSALGYTTASKTSASVTVK